MKTKAQLWQEASAIIDAAQAEERALTEAERRAYEKLIGQMEALDHEERSAELLRPRRDVRMLPGYSGDVAPSPRGLTRSQRLTDHHKLTQAQRDLSFGKYVKGIVTGDWQGAEEERAMSIGTNSAGGYLVPTPLAAEVLDLARNRTRVIQAGALTVPMEVNTLKIAKVLTDPTPTWHSESGTITPTDGSLGLVTLTARTLVSIVKFSRELFEDADNFDSLLTNMFANAFAVELDRAALYGSGTPPEPSGIMDQIADASQANVSMGTNGAVLTDYTPFNAAIYAIQSANYEPNAAIYAPRTARDLANLLDDIGNPREMPEPVANLTKLVTKQVPIARTQGTSSVASDIIVGQWDQLLIGLRSNFNITLVTERYVETGEYALSAWLRADVVAAHIAAFCAVVGVLEPS